MLTDTAVLCSPIQYFLFICLLVTGKISYSYSRLDILKIGFGNNQAVTSEFLKSHNIPEETARTPGSPWIVNISGKHWRWRRHSKQKRGCWSGLLARDNPTNHLFPVYFSPTPDNWDRRDELQLQINCHEQHHKGLLCPTDNRDLAKSAHTRCRH